MSTYQLTELPTMKTQMLIRRPVHEVFEAFVDPAITTKFWFTKSSGRVEQGAELTWTWEMYGVSSLVKAKAVEADRRILLERDLNTQPVLTEWRFFPQKDDTTFVTITEHGYHGTADEAVARAIGSMGGFSFLLASAKAWLEYGIELNLVLDHDPKGISKDLQ